MNVLAGACFGDNISVIANDLYLGSGYAKFLVVITQKYRQRTWHRPRLRRLSQSYMIGFLSFEGVILGNDNDYES